MCLLRQLAICHLLLALALVAMLRRDERAGGYLLCVVGLGGLTAAWSRYTLAGGHWLELRGARGRPDRQTLQTALSHLPALVLGLYFLRRAAP